MDLTALTSSPHSDATSSLRSREPGDSAESARSCSGARPHLPSASTAASVRA